MLHTFRKRLNFSFMIIILFMILSRLVWMQLRTYELKWSQSLISAHATLTHKKSSVCKNITAIRKDFSLENYELYIAPEATDRTLQRPYLWAMKYLCHSSQPYQSFMNWQWLMVVLIILSSVFLSRILTSSWLISLLVGATLLSRGSLLAQIGLFSGELTITCMISCLLCCVVHFLRTGSSPGVLVSCFILLAGSALSPVFLFISLTILIYLPFKFRDFSPPDQRGVSQAARLFRHKKIFGPIQSPFRTWVVQDMNSTYLLGLWGALSILSFLIYCGSLQAGFDEISGSFLNHLNMLPTISELPITLRQWGYLTFVSWDLHYSVSVIFIIVAGWTAIRKGHWALKETLYVFGFLSLALAMLSILTSPFLLSPVDKNFLLPGTQPYFPRPDLIYFANWLEPAILTLGIVCLYHMLKKSPGDLKALKKQNIGE